MPLFLTPSSGNTSLEAVQIQAKRLVDEPDDAFEREAEEIARRAAESPAPAGALPPDPPHAEGAPVTQPPEGAGPTLLPPDEGAPLAGHVRARVEPLLGLELLSARVHTGPAAQRAAASLGARAFTHRNHIWLGPGESTEDVRLLAHEAAHVAQQTGGERGASRAVTHVGTEPGPAAIQRSTTPEERERDREERERDREERPQSADERARDREGGAQSADERARDREGGAQSADERHDRPGVSANASATDTASPVLDRELAEVTAGGAVVARRTFGQPTRLEPGASPPEPAQPAVMPPGASAPERRAAERAPSTNAAAPAAVGATRQAWGPAARPSSPAAPRSAATPGQAPPAASGQGPEAARDGGPQQPAAAAGQAPPAASGQGPEAARDGGPQQPAATRTGAQGEAPERAPDGSKAPEGGAPGVGRRARGEVEATEAAGQEPDGGDALVEAAVSQMPAPNPDAIRGQALSDPTPLVEGDPAAARARIQQLLASLRAEGARQKERIASAAEARKQELGAEAEARIAAIDATESAAIDAVRTSFGAARASVQAEAAARRAELAEISRTESERAAAVTAERVNAIETELGQRQTALARDARTASLQPPILAENEAARAERELEAAARECEQAGEAVAAQHPGSGDAQAEKRAAGRRVGRESAADIRDKKAPIRRDLLGRARGFSGQYFEYAGTVSRQIDGARADAAQALAARGEGVGASIQEAEAGPARAIEQRLSADLAALDAAEAQAVARVQAAAASARAEVRSTAARASGLVDALALAGSSAIDTRVLDVEAAVGDDPEATTAGGAAAVQDAVGAVAQIAAAVEDQLATATTAGLGELGAVTARFEPAAAELRERGASTAREIGERSAAALGRASEGHRAQARATVAAMEGDQATLTTQVLAEVDRALADARRELAGINARFRDEVRSAADSAIEEAIKPRTDPVETRAAEAARQVDDAWYKGLFRAIGQIVLGLVILVVVALVVAAIAAAFGVILTAWTAIMIAGALLLAAGFVMALIHRSSQRAYRGRTGAMIGRAFLDAIGVTGIQEAWTGHDVATGDALTPGQKWERGTLGVVTLISLALGLRSVIKGPPGGVFTRPSGMPRGLSGIRGLFTEGPGGWRGLWGGVKQLGGRMAQGAKSVWGEMVTGARQSVARLRGWWANRRAGKNSRWADEFWPDDLEKLPLPEEIINVDAASIKNTTPEFVTTPEYPEGAWKWTLFDEASGAKFCEVFVRASGGRSSPQGGPELWLHTKQALLPNGQRVQLKPNGFRWTVEALRHAMRTFRDLFGHAPENMSGDLAADNLGIFQQKFAELRAAHPEWTRQQIGNEAVKATPFGRTRVEAGYGDLRPEMSEFGQATYKGAELADVPNAVRVEALPSQTPPPEGPRPLPQAPLPTAPRDDTGDR